jgi:hypothetical protein
MGHDPKAAPDGDTATLGASGRGTLSFIAAKKDGSLPSEIQAAATRAIAAILDQAYAAARETLLENMDKLRKIGVYLVAQERIDGDTFDALFDGTIDVPDAESEWRPAAARPREWAAITAMAASRETVDDDSVGAAAD